MTPHEDMLTIAFYDGEFNGDLASLVLICEIEGRVRTARPSTLPASQRGLEVARDERRQVQRAATAQRLFYGFCWSQNRQRYSATRTSRYPYAQRKCECQRGIRTLPTDRYGKRSLHRGR